MLTKHGIVIIPPHIFGYLAKIHINSIPPQRIGCVIIEKILMSIEQNHFFALFGLPADFLIDKTTLKNRFLQLQKQHHPDNNQMIDAEKNASLINQAYNTLLADDSRAIYILNLMGVEVDMSASIDDEAFLDDMMQIRMDLEDTENSDELLTLKQTVADKLTEFCQDFYHVYHQKNWQVAIQIAQKLKFLSNLQKSIVAKLTKLHQQDEADDDLYV